MLQTFADIIEKFGYAKLAEALGRPEGTVSSWKTRDSIPPDVWSSLVDAAARHGVEGISLDVLAALAEKRTHRSQTGAGGAHGEAA